MSLIVARKICSKIVLFADTRLTDQMASRPFNPTLGTAKIRFVDDRIAICFAGNTHFAERAIQQLQTGTSKTNIIDHFKESTRISNGATDYLICFAENSEIYEIKNERVQLVESSWIGSHSAFTKFRSFESGASFPVQSRENTFDTRILRVPEDLSDPLCLFSSLFNFFSYTLADSSILEVGDFLFAAAQEGNRFRLVNYSDSISHPIDFSQMPREFVVPFGTAEQGGFTFEFLHSDQVNAAAVYFLQGNFGLLFWCNSDFSAPVLIRDVTPAGFVFSIERDYGYIFKSGYEHPDQYSKLGKAAFEIGDNETAVVLFSKCIDGLNLIGDDSSSTYLRRGIARAKMGDNGGAFIDFDEAINRNSSIAWFYDSRAVLKYHLGDLEGAIHDFTKAISLDGSEISYFEKRSACHAKMGHNDLAVADIRIAEKIRNGGN